MNTALDVIKFYSLSHDARATIIRLFLALDSSPRKNYFLFL